MRHLLFLFIFLLVIKLAYSQDSVKDSFYNILLNHPVEDTTKVNILNDLSYQYQYVDFHKSLGYAEQSLKMAERLSFRKGIAMANYRKAYCYWALGYNEVSIEKAMQAIDIAEHESLTTILAESFRVLAMNYRDQQGLEKASLYIKQAEKLSMQEKDWDLLSRVYNTAGLIQFDKKKNDTSSLLFSRAFQITNQYKTSKFHVCQIISNMGECQLENNPDIALKYFKEALVLAKEVRNKQAEAGIMCDIGRALTRKSKYIEADKYLQSGLRLSHELGLKRVTRHAYLALVDLKVREGKSTESFEFMKSYYDVRDSLLNAAKTRQIVELETRHENEKKEQAIKLLEQDKRIQKIWRNILIAGLILLGALSAGIYYLQWSRENKNREILNLQIDNLVSQNKELTDKYKHTLTSGNEKLAESQEQRLLKKAIEIIEGNIADPLFSVEKMGEEMGMSRTSMHRKIKEITGFPPSELIRNIRLRKAASMLRSETDSVSQIGFAVGFEDHSYFSKAFKKQFGVSPSEYHRSTSQMTDEA
jgi:AraC-like DNA-binding protein